MREILFRGKRIDTGEWVQGYYFKVWDEHYICWGSTNGVVNKLLVIPETVGQDTGLKDKNGVKIFEGDIVKGYSVYPEPSIFEPFLMGEVYYTNRGTWDSYSYILGGFNEQVEVIGNIHDNPELVEVME